MTIPEKLKVDHLFVLVGENPLPNYIAARTLLKEGGIVYLVFTEETRSQKNCLKGKYGLHSLGIKCQEVDLANYESDAYNICDRIKRRVDTIKDSKIGLNYTGGTKAMAVHAYRTIQKLKSDAIFSYLDSRRLKMWINEGEEKAENYDVSLQLSLEELFNLHGKYLLNNFLPQCQPCLFDLAKKIVKIHNNKESEKKWKDWCNKLTSIFELENIFPEVAKLLTQYINIDQNKSLTEKAKEKGFISFQDFHIWLNGTWLESYVLKIIKEISNDIDIKDKDSKMSFYVTEYENPINTNNKQEDAKFEFDVAFIKGYQLYAISCTTKSRKPECKEKLFEAYIRARELGGDEARVALVSCYDEPRKIEEEFSRYGIKNPRIKVFGRDDLANLADGIANWIERNNLEAQG